MNKEEKLSHGLRQIVKSSIIIFIGLILSKLFTYLYRIVIARQLGPEAYGLFSLALIILTWFILFSMFGLNDGILRYISIYRQKKQAGKINYIFKFTAKVFIVSGILAGLILFLSAGFISINIFHNEGLIPFLKIFSFLIVFSTLSSIFFSVMKAFEQIFSYSLVNNILQNFTRLLALVFLIFVGLKINAIIFSHLLGIVITLLVAYFICKHKFPYIFRKTTISSKSKKEVRRELVSYSWPIMFSGMIMVILYSIDSFLIGYFQNATEVGYYNAAIPLMALLGFIPEIFMQLFFPLITKEFSRKDTAFIRDLSKQVGKWILIFNIPVFLILIIFPEAVINLFFGEKYVIAATALRFLSIGGFFSSFFLISNNLISMAGKSKLILGNFIVMFVLNFGLNWFLIPKYGINGAAFATMIVLILSTIVSMLELKIFIKVIPLKKDFLKILLISVIPTLLLIYLKGNIPSGSVSLILLSVFFFLIYIILLFTTHCLDKNDFMILGTLKRKFFGATQFLNRD